MTKLVVLDYSVPDVHFYDIEDSVDVEEFISNLGSRLSECNWMVGNFDIFYHKGIVK